MLFTDAARSNTVEAAMLGGISYTNNLLLNPRPQTNSPALGNVLPHGAGLTPTTYRGAFSTNDLWAHKWTAIYDLGYLADTWFSGGVVLVPLCAPLSITRSAGDVTISWTSIAGATYQLVSKTDLAAAWWINEGPPIASNCGELSVTFSATTGNKFYAVTCY